MLCNQLTIFKPKLYICLEVVKSELVQSVFNWIKLTETEMVNMKGAETDCSRFDPKTISIFPKAVHLATA